MSKEKYIPRLKKEYTDVISKNIASQLNIKNQMRIPKIKKISLNMGLGDAKDNKNSLKQAVNELTNIAGQKAVITYSKKAISNFKLRIGDPVGVRVTLRSKMMYEFLDPNALLQFWIMKGWVQHLLYQIQIPGLSEERTPCWFLHPGAFRIFLFFLFFLLHIYNFCLYG